MARRPKTMRRTTPVGSRSPDEVVSARGSYGTLGQRLDGIEAGEGGPFIGLIDDSAVEVDPDGDFRITLDTGDLISATGGTNVITLEVDHSSDPGANQKLLSTDTDGYVTVERIGLGIAPDYPLHVSGESYLHGDLTVHTTTGLGTIVGARSVDDMLLHEWTVMGRGSRANAAQYNLYESGAVVISLRTDEDSWIDTGSGLGIGTQAPGAMLHVLDPDTPQFRIAYDTDNYTDLSVDGSGMLTLSPTGEAVALDGVLRLGDNSTPVATLEIYHNDTVTPAISIVDSAFNSANFVLDPDDFTISTAFTPPNIVLAPAGDLTLDPGGDDVLPGSGYAVNLGALSNKYLTLHAAELWVETLVAQDTMATIGGRILVGPTTSLIADIGTSDTTITVEHDQMASGDVAYLEAGGKVEFISIDSGPTSVSGGYEYTVTRDLDGSGANEWYAGDAVFNTGASGDGFIDLYSLSGVSSGAGPTIVGNVRQSGTYNDWVESWAIGNLNGLYGYGSDTYGVGLGEYGEANYLTIDPSNGVRFFDSGGTIRAQLSSDTWTLGATGAAHVEITPTALSLIDDSGTDMIVLGDGGDSYFAGVMTIGASGEIRQGSGSLGTDFTGLRIWRQSGIGRIGGYNDDTLQWYALTDGALYAGGGNVRLAADGLTIVPNLAEWDPWSSTDDTELSTALKMGTLGGTIYVHHWTEQGGTGHFSYHIDVEANPSTAGPRTNLYLTALGDDGDAQIHLVGQSQTGLATEINLDADIVSISDNLDVNSGVLYVDSVNNRVGVNDSSPSYSLDVVGTFHASGTSTFSGNVDINATLDVGSDFDVGSGDLYVDVSAGRVGVGTTSPSTTFDVHGSAIVTSHLGVNGQAPSSAYGINVEDGSTAAIRTYRDNSGEHIRFLYAGVRNWGIYIDARFHIRDVSSSANRISINSDGWVAINDDTPAFHFEVQGSRSSSYVSRFWNTGGADNYHGIIVQCGGSPNPSSTFIAFRDASSSTIGFIDGDGAGGVDYNTSSDERIKDDIRDLGGALETIRALRPVTWRGKGRGESAPRAAGLVAQEVEQVIPSIVSTDPDGMKAVAYGRLGPFLLAAIKEQDKEIQALRARIETLENIRA